MQPRWSHTNGIFYFLPVRLLLQSGLLGGLASPDRHSLPPPSRSGFVYHVITLVGLHGKQLYNFLLFCDKKFNEAFS